MKKKGTKVYQVRKDVRCLSCHNKGAIQYYGNYHPNGVGELADEISAYKDVKSKPYMSHAMGFGGTIPHECLNCGNVGLIDFGGLEGYKHAFETMNDADYCVELAERILKSYPTTEDELYVRSFHTKANLFTVYEDDTIEIQSAKGTRAISIELKQPHDNPVIVLNDEGHVIRSHGERHYFLSHAKKLLGIDTSD